VRLALKTFAVCKTENVLCEAGLPTLTEMRDENRMRTVIRIMTNKNHPTTSQMINQNIYNDYVMIPGSPKPFFIRAAEHLRQIDIDGRKVEKTPDYTRPPWYANDRKSMNWSLCTMRKGTPNELFLAELQELVNEK
jgi:DNA-binding response OmpR family regulator